MHKLLAFTAALALAAPAAAQATTFDLLQSSSNFNWSGTSSVGPIQGNPSTAFQLAGTLEASLVLQPGAQPVAAFAFLSGAAATVPDLHGRIPNPIPLLPPLATIDVIGLVLSPSSASAPVGAGGTFNAQVVLTATAGTFVVTPLGGSSVSTSLVGLASAPTASSGTIALIGGALRLTWPVNVTFPFMDPGSGVSGTITIVGTAVSEHVLLKSYCAGDGSGTPCPCGNHAPAGSGRGCLNSTGVGALLAGSGSALLGADTLVLSASGMPVAGTALYFQGTSQLNGGAGAVFGDGKRCAGGTNVRLATLTSAGGASSYPPAGFPPVSVRGLVPASGGTRTYQVWYRNSVAYCTSDGWNLTNGLRVLWRP
jgi:hypothetical protein